MKQLWSSSVPVTERVDLQVFKCCSVAVERSDTDAEKLALEDLFVLVCCKNMIQYLVTVKLNLYLRALRDKKVTEVTKKKKYLGLSISCFSKT